MPNASQDLKSAYGFALEYDFMDVSKILLELKDERRNIDEAIAVLERLAGGRGRRRGRPPGWLNEVTTNSVDEPQAPRRRGRPPGSKNKAKDE